MPDRSGEPRPGRDTPAETPLEAKRAAQAAARAALQADYANEHHTRQAALEARATAIHACTLCDTDGYRRHVVCDHTDHRPAAARGIAAVRAALASKHAPGGPNTRQA